MAEGDGERPPRRSRLEPQGLASIQPTIGQRRTARLLVLALLGILAATWPFATARLPEINAFVPSLAAALFVSDCVTAVLLFSQFAILRQWGLLIIANGYLFSGLIVVAHALAFPGAFSSTGLFGSGLQSAVWIYWSWHSALPLAIIGYALVKDRDSEISHGLTRFAIGSSVLGTTALVIGIFWFVTHYHDILPVTFVDVRPLSLFRRIVGGVVILVLGGIALYLLWARRRTLLDEWLMVALCALLIEVALAAVLSGDRFTVSWYAGRFYQLVTATVVMVVLLVEMTTLYRLMLERAVQAQHREREARLMTGNAVSASIAHELRQPLTAMVTTADAGLRFLDRSVPNLDRAKEAFKRIVADGHRAGAMIGTIRANFRSEVGETTSFPVRELVQDALGLVRGDLQKYGIVVQVDPNMPSAELKGNRVQLQQVLLNLIMNAVDAMTAGQERRVLTVKSELRDGNRVVTSIADTGTGIGPEHIDRIFNPLFTTKSNGMGMGLAICRAIIEAHEGRLWFTPNAPRGAVFQFSLQAHPAAAAAGESSARVA